MRILSPPVLVDGKLEIEPEPTVDYRLPLSGTLSDIARLHMATPFLRGEMLDGVTERRSGHTISMVQQKRLQSCGLPIPNLPEHPPYRLMHEIVRVCQKLFREIERFRSLAATNEVQSGQHGDSVIPEGG